MTEEPVAGVRTMDNDTQNRSVASTGETDIEIWSKDVMFWGQSIIIPIGLLFNGISVPVFMSRSLRVRSASWYLAALALTDIIVLLTYALEYWMKDPQIGIPVTQMSSGLCVLVSHLSCASRLLSAVLVTSFTIERFICVVAPLKRAALSKPGRARKVIALQSLFCVLCTSFVPFTLGISPGINGRSPECDVRPDKREIYLICTAVFLLFGSIFIPIVVIITLNAFVMRKLCLRRSSLTHVNSNSHVAFARQVRKHNFNTATILMAVSTSFVILNIPYCISFLMLFFQSSGVMTWGTGALGNLFAAKYLTSVPYLLNYCINFLLYNVCARAFRVEMGRLMCYFCRAYKHRLFSFRNRSSTQTRTTQSLSSSLRSRKSCGQFFAVPTCNGHCIRPETSSFASDPANFFQVPRQTQVNVVGTSKFPLQNNL